MNNVAQQLHIEKVVYGGDGLARTGPDTGGRRMTAFVPYTLPGEQITASLDAPKKSFARGRLLQVLQPSPERVEPGCPYFGRCGGCQLQHGSYDWQLQAKRAMLAETFARAGVELPQQVRVVSAEPYGYRSRVRLHVDAQGRAGYLQRASHRLLVVDQCPIASPLIGRAIRALSQSPAPANISEIELAATPPDTGLLLSAVCGRAPANPQQFRAWMHALATEITELQGGLLQQDMPHQPPRLLAKFLQTTLASRVADHTYRVSAGSFFQGNRLLLDRLVAEVMAAASQTEHLTHTTATRRVLWDLFAGVGLFSLPLAAAGFDVIAVEGAPSSSRDLSHNATGPSVRVESKSVESFLTAQTNEKPDVVLVDPPRTGLSLGAVTALRKLRAHHLVYLSCDPVTLARDIHLLAGTYQVGSATLIDLFPQTFHMETLVTLTLP